jgi:hypothetical protein
VLPEDVNKKKVRKEGYMVYAWGKVANKKTST